MDIYTVTNIEEADYGCEENFEGARALLTLTNSGKDELRVQAAEEWLAQNKIDIGAEVYFDAEKKLRRFN